MTGVYLVSLRFECCICDLFFFPYLVYPFLVAVLSVENTVCVFCTAFLLLFKFTKLFDIVFFKMLSNKNFHLQVVFTILFLNIYGIRCTTLLPPFFSEIRGFIVKKLVIHL